MAIGFAAVQHHLSDTREVSQCRVDDSTAELTARPGRTIHDVEGVRLRAQGLPESLGRVGRQRAAAADSLEKPAEHGGIQSLVLPHRPRRIFTLYRPRGICKSCDVLHERVLMIARRDAWVAEVIAFFVVDTRSHLENLADGHTAITAGAQLRQVAID